MKKIILILCILFSYQLSQALPLTNTNRILGGDKAPRLLWAVKLALPDGEFCTGAQVNKEYILTARHCVDGINPDDVKVHFIEGTNDKIAPIGHSIDKIYAVTKGDIALLHLKNPDEIKNTVYATLNLKYKSTEATPGKVRGYGLRSLGDDAQSSEVLFELPVSVRPRYDKDEYNGKAFIVHTKDGYIYDGDSGGPLMVDEKIIGVSSSSEEINGKPTKVAYYASLPAHDKWIKCILKSHNMNNKCSKT